MAKMVWNSKEDLLEEAKENKKRELSSSCQEDILSGFDFEIGENTYHFSYDREAQVNLQERWQLFQNNMVDVMDITAKLDGEHVRLKVDSKMFDKIYLESVKAKEDKIKKLRDDLFPLVDRATDEKDLEGIVWDMTIIEPEPDSIVFKDDALLNKEVKRIELDGAVSNSEMMKLITMMGMM